ncbi:MAG: hypothetical protein Q7T48_16075, partial [Cellvibrio sp.]|uniref:hypothetical protein n=1 Tax=Cellvibrio sp. TaxID=1965322 RepID=UPI002727CD61|nr:hypothetical protein [Cellvibrio sp.]
STKEQDALLETQYVKTPPSKIKTPVQSLLAAAQPRDYLQQLHLTHDQWQDVCSELILHQAIMNTDAASDLLQSIKNVAQQALNTASYYRKVVNALLQQQPLDLELFVKTESDNAQNNSLALTASTSISSATDDLLAATNPLTAAASVYTSRNNNDGDDKDLPKIQSQNDATKTEQLSNEDGSAVNDQLKPHIQHSTMNTYVQSLLAAAQPVEHLQQLHLNNHQWQEICRELIPHQATMENDDASDLLQSIKTFAQQALNTASYYRKVVHALLQQQPLDLELFANAANTNTPNNSLELTAPASTGSATNDLPMATNPLTAATSVYTSDNNGDKYSPKIQSQIDTTKTVQLSKEDLSPVHEQNETKIQQSIISTHVQSLLATAQPVEYLQQLHVSNDQWQDICSELILHQATMDTNAASDLLQSIKTFAQQALNTTSYYRKVVHALLQQQPLDLELFAKAESDNTQNKSLALTVSTSISSATDDLLAATNPLTAAASVYTSRNNDDDDKYSLNIQSQIELDKTEQLSNEDRSVVHEQNETKIQPSAIHTHVQSLLTASQPVEYLLQLHLSNDQWQEICRELILHQANMNTDAASDLLQSIKTFAQHALNTANYYRKIVHALLQQQPIDLELFSKTEGDNTQNNSLALTASTSISPTTTDLPMATSPITTMANADGFTSQHSIDGGDKDLQNTQSQIDTDRTVRLSTKEQDALLETQYVKTPPSKIKTPVQSLLAAAQPRDYLQQL